GGPVFTAFTANNFTSFFERSYFVGERAQGPQLTVTGGSGFLDWKFIGDVPPGFRLSLGTNFNHTVMFEANFTQAGTFTFSIQVTDDASRFATLGPITAVVGPYIDFASGTSLRSGIAG